MKRLFKALIFTLLSMVLICSADFAESVTENKGMYVNGISQGDFPLDNGFVSAGIKEQLRQIADFAKAHGYKRIYFEAVNESKAMYRSITLQPCKKKKNTDIDPLKELISVCHSDAHRLAPVAVFAEQSVNIGAFFSVGLLFKKHCVAGCPV